MWRYYLLRPRVIFSITLLLLLLGVFFLWFLGEEKNPLTPEDKKILLENEKIERHLSYLYENQGTISNLDFNEIGKAYSSERLILVKDNSTSTIQKYSKDLKKALEPITLIKTNPMNTLLLAQETGDKKYIEELQIVSNLYKSSLSNLLATPVPTSASIGHIRLLNTLNELSFLTFSMASFPTEPLKAFQAGRYFSEAFKKMVADFNFINNYFAKGGIIFDNSNKIVFVDFSLQQ